MKALVKGLRKMGLVALVVILVCQLNTADAKEYLVINEDAVTSDETPAQIIRVGVFELPGFQETTEDGRLYGYNYEYLLQLGDITGWSYEFVEILDQTEGLKLLANHEIDLLAPMEYTESWDEIYDYSEYKVSNQYLGLLTDPANEDYYYCDFDSFGGMRVGVVADSLSKESFIDFEEENDLELELVNYGNYREAIDAMFCGEVDACVANLLYAMESEKSPKAKVLARFEGQDVYYMTYAGNDDFMKQLNAAMSELSNKIPRLLETLSAEYYSIFDELYFTVEQKEYIENSGVIRVGYDTDQIPVSYQNGDGEFDGIERDILDIIADITGLTFEYVPLSSDGFSYEYLYENNIQIVAGVQYSPYTIHRDYMTTTNSYIEMSNVIVTREDDVFEEEDEVGVATREYSDSVDDVVAQMYPNLEVQSYTHLRECLESIMMGDTDMMVLNHYVAEYWLGSALYEGLEAIQVEGLGDTHCLGVTEFTENYRTVRDIINVAIAQININDINSIVVRNIEENQAPYEWGEFFTLYKVEILSVIFVVIVVFVLMWYNITRQVDINEKLQENEKKLYAERARYNLIMEKSKEVIYETDLIMHTRNSTDMMKEKFGWHVEDWSGEDPTEGWKIHDQDVKNFKETFKDVVENKHSTECSVRLLDKNDEFVWCRITRYPVLNADGSKVIKVIGRITDVDEQIKENEILKQQNRTDSMTGLLNKATFIREVDNYISSEEAKDFCLVFLDMDHFKSLNDTLGHLMGDDAIKATASKLQLIFANSDLVARFGGDEFCVLVKNIPIETMQMKLEMIRTRLRQKFSDGNASVTITVSVGAVHYHTYKDDVHTMIEYADNALYASKEGGRDRTTFVQF